MVRKITLWRIWESGDMANSDDYYPTKKEALAALKSGYDVTQLVPSDMDSVWEGEIPEHIGGGGTVYLEQIEVVPTRAGLAHAFKHIPHR